MFISLFIMTCIYSKVPQPFMARVQDLKKGPHTNENTDKKYEFRRHGGPGGNLSLGEAHRLLAGLLFIHFLDTHLATGSRQTVSK